MGSGAEQLLKDKTASLHKPPSLQEKGYTHMDVMHMHVLTDGSIKRDTVTAPPLRTHTMSCPITYRPSKEQNWHSGPKLLIQGTHCRQQLLCLLPKVLQSALKVTGDCKAGAAGRHKGSQA